jgi:hypothetical protein
LRSSSFIVAAAIAALSFVGAGSTRAAVISTRDMARGFSANPVQCAALHLAVWVNIGGRGFCIRYYLSTAGGSGSRPAVFLQGDRLSGTFDRRTGRFIADPGGGDVSIESLVKFTGQLSNQTGTTAIYLARIGIDGSSGHHDVRRSVLETTVLNQALDVIKQRHRLEGYHLIGQSGGAANVGGLLALRRDIGCAVIGSGPLAARRSIRSAGTDPLLLPFNPTDRIAAIIRNRPGRILVITDPFDRVVRAENQSVFAHELVRAGGRAEQYYVEAKDRKHHVVTPYAGFALVSCIQGRSEQEIARGLDELTRQRVPLSQGPGKKPSTPLPQRHVTQGSLQ